MYVGTSDDPVGPTTRTVETSDGGQVAMNVVVVTPSAAGGMLHYCSQLSNALSGTHDVSAIVEEGADESLFDEEVSVEPMEFPSSKSALVREGVPLWTRLYRRLSAPAVDVVHVTDLNPLLVPPMLALRRPRTVFTLHDVYNHPGEESILDEITRFLLVHGTDRVVVHGEYNARQIRQRYRLDHEMVRINHGEYSFFREYCDAPVRYEPELLFFGRIVSYKGVETLFAADRYLADAVGDYRLTVAGRGPLNVRGDPGDHVTIRNEFVPNEQVCELFSRCRAVVLPYREASQSGIVPIAYSFGKPVVATAVGGLPEIVNHGRTGLLVEPEDPEALAEACASLLNDPDAAREMGENTFEFQRERMAWADIAETLTTEAYED